MDTAAPYMKVTLGAGRSLAVSFVIAALFGCAQSQSGAVIPPNLAASQSIARVTTAALPSSTVYVAQACNSQQCYPAPGLVSELQGGSITDGVSSPVALALDNSGRLYVANAPDNDEGNVTVYSRNGQLMQVLTGFLGNPYDMVFDNSGDLYIVSTHVDGCCEIKGDVTIFPPGATRPSSWLAGIGGFPGKGAFDGGNYYQPNFWTFPGWIGVYSVGATTTSRTIQGLGFPMQVKVDAYGELYVLNNIFGGGADVLVYARNGSAPIATIQTGVLNASAIAIDAEDELYVANRAQGTTPGSVSIYAPWTTKPWRTIHEGITNPVTLALDASGTLYVGNAPAAGTNTVTVYAPNTTTPEATYPLTYAPTAILTR